MNILLIGGNGFGKVHAETYRRLGFDFSVYDRNDQVLNLYRKDYGIHGTYSDLTEALSSNSDIVDIVLPHHLHYEVAMKALEAGKHVLIEKPITGRIDEAIKLINQSKRRNLKFMVAEQFFFDPSFKRAMEAIENGKIGSIRTIIVRDQQRYDAPGWRSRRSEMMGGSLIDGGVHFLELFLDFGGEWKDISCHNYKGGTSLEGEDNTAALFTFRNGAYGIFYYSWSYQDPPRLPAYEVIGTDGSIYEMAGSSLMKPDEIRTVLNPPVLNGTMLNVEWKDVYESEIGGFIESVEKDIDVPYPPENALRNLDVVLEMYRR
ncbi:gfo/Idh/MocA family oxidoreductase [Thermoplasma sp. Kam2015]|uniref:Gfo/Idh/MocA family protein n=1 Tax=Thermoplasma sp. Kam2015 TaxID=2094122 RepID=UPI000D94591A|nr:Gfo/Idh/MocA family oxidoreductase [Thermoplasma sp. Kam2015]PYB68515.1 gfo/Idh/MocA family oxidoreductase [Thermoplasma sp. Kam2015]